jgi:hypothetical protein
MQKIELTIINTENIGHLSPTELLKIQEIFTALVASGGLTGVKGGKTIIHFDAEANFMGVELAYWPFRRRKSQ